MKAESCQKQSEKWLLVFTKINQTIMKTSHKYNIYLIDDTYDSGELMVTFKICVDQSNKEKELINSYANGGEMIHVEKYFTKQFAEKVIKKTSKKLDELAKEYTGTASFGRLTELDVVSIFRDQIKNLTVELKN